MKKILSSLIVAVLLAVTTFTFLPNVALAYEIEVRDISQLQNDYNGNRYPLFYMDKNEKVKDPKHYIWSFGASIYDTIKQMEKEDGRYYIYVPLNGRTMILPYEIDLPSNVTIKFENGTLDCQNRSRAFNLYGDNVKLILDNITIKNGITGRDETAWSSSDRGGGIYVDGDHCSIIGRNGTTIRDCYANYSGGGLEIDGVFCNVENINFHNCTSKYGGAVYIYWAFSKLTNCAFSKTCVGSDGGNFIYADHGLVPTGIINPLDLSIYKNPNSGAETLIQSFNIPADSSGFTGYYKIYKTNEEWENDYSRYKSDFTGSMVSQGNLWIIIVVAAVVVLAVVALIILKKKGIIKTKQNA